MPIVKKMLTNNDDMKRIAYLIAAYRHYLKYRIDDRGVGFEIFEPKITKEDIEKLNDDDAARFLTASPFEMVDLVADYKFVDLYLYMARQIKEHGAMNILESIL